MEPGVARDGMWECGEVSWMGMEGLEVWCMVLGEFDDLGEVL